MNRLVFAAVLALPSVALAHPGHSHEGMSPYHHIISALTISALVVGGYFVSRFVTSKVSNDEEK